MTSDHGGGSITSVLQETRVFPPPADFASKAHIGSLAQYEALWNRAKDDPEGFWGEQAQAAGLGQALGQGARLAAAVCEVVRRRAAQRRRITASTATATGPTKNKAALIWEGEPGDRRVLRYQDLLREVSKFANVLKGLGVQKGRRRRGLHADDPRAGHRAAWPVPGSERRTR